MSAKRARLLVVDDDDDLRTTLPMILAAAGYPVRSASDGFTALVAIQNEVPDILISDLNMPGMSGFELLAVVRRRFASISVIAMSSAFSGLGVPEGVAADVFYEKATGVPSLLHLVESMESLQAPRFRPQISNRASQRAPGGGLPSTSAGAISSS